MLELSLLYAGGALSLAAAAWAVVRLGATRTARGRGPETVLVVATAALAGFLVARGVRLDSFPVTDLGGSLALFSLALGVCYLALARGGGRPSPGLPRQPSEASAKEGGNLALGAFVLPVAAALAVASGILVSIARPRPQAFDAVFLALHAIPCFAAYAAFAFGSGAGVAYMIQERALRSKRLGRLSERLPSLSVLDDLSYRAVTLGFPLLTFGMVMGAVWAATEWGSYWFWEPKLTLALLLWLLGAAIFHLRTIEKYHGRRTALLAIASAVMVLVVFLGASLFPGGRHVFL